ncbi:MAG: mechanosensitive ion channel [Clostridia bacterium]|nr:mechanosensitive ion channel [Clostridia bacterium]
MIEKLNQAWTDFYSNAGLTITYCILFFILGLIFIKLLQSGIRKATIKSKRLDNAASTFVTSIISILLYIALLIALLAIMGVSTAGIIAAFSASALAIALGLQTMLSSIANGILIIFTKPFKQGDFIEIGGISGTVKNIRLVNITLNTPDNRIVIVPNNTVLTANLINYSTMPLRRLDLIVPIPYDSDIDRVKDILLQSVQRETRIVNTPAPFCRLTNYGASSLDFTIRVWVENADYWPVKFDLLEAIFKDLRAAGIEIPFNQLDVHVINPQTGADFPEQDEKGE